MKKIYVSLMLLSIYTSIYAQSPQTINYTLTAASPTFNRPIANGVNPPTNLSGIGTNVYYTTFSFVAPISGSYTFANTFAGDGFGILYTSPFNPAAPLTNGLQADDDGNSGPSNDDYLMTRTLTAGVTYVLVSTTYGNGATGAGSTIITGPFFTVLPLKWLSVSSYTNNTNKAKISWQVEEVNVNYFVVEKLIDNVYTTVATIVSKGDGTNEYSIIDEATFLYNTKAEQYRIKYVDKDGKYNYSPITSVRNVNKLTLTAYPNPVVNNLQIINNQIQPATILDATGKTITTIQLKAGTTFVNTANWARGVYFIKTNNNPAIKFIKE